MSIAAFKTEILANNLTSHSADSVEVWNNNGVLKIAIYPVVGVSTPTQAVLDALIAKAEQFSAPQLGGLGVSTVSSGTVTIAGGSGSVDSITVGGVEIMSGAEAFDTDLTTTAAAIVVNINAFQSVFVASSVAAVITISGGSFSGDTVIGTGTTMTAVGTPMVGVSAKGKVEVELLAPRESDVLYGSFPPPNKYSN